MITEQRLLWIGGKIVYMTKRPDFDDVLDFFCDSLHRQDGIGRE
jgi:hypothetical protein